MSTPPDHLQFAARLEPSQRQAALHLAADELCIALEGGEPPFVVPFDDIREITCDTTRVTVTRVREGPVVLESVDAHALARALVRAICTLPEFTAALRSLGAGAQAIGDAQREFLLPLLDARRRMASAVTRAEMVRALDPGRIEIALQKYEQGIADTGADARPSARRARMAMVHEATQPMRQALRDVIAAAAVAGSPPEEAQVASWRAWTAAVQHLFSAADQCWRSLTRRDRASADWAG